MSHLVNREHFATLLGSINRLHFVMQVLYILKCVQMEQFIYSFHLHCQCALNIIDAFYANMFTELLSA